MEVYCRDGGIARRKMVGAVCAVLCSALCCAGVELSSAEQELILLTPGGNMMVDLEGSSEFQIKSEQNDFPGDVIFRITDDKIIAHSSIQATSVVYPSDERIKPV